MDDDLKTELEATIAARRELGADHEDHLVAGFLDRIQSEIDRRVDERLPEHRRPTVPLPAVLGPMIPIVIFAGIFGGTAGVVAALAVVLVLVLISELRR